MTENEYKEVIKYLTEKLEICKDEINRQRAEIEMLKNEIGFNNTTIWGLELENCCQTLNIEKEFELAKAEAIKECLQAVRKRTSSYICAARIRRVTDKIEKEMVGDE